MTDAAFTPITELSRRIETGNLDPVVLTEIFLARIDGIGRPLNCYISLDRAGAMVSAQAASRRAARNDRVGPLDGIPIAVKDNIDVAGLATTNGLGGAHAAAAEDAPVIANLKKAGAVILGKLNMQEGALGGVTDNVHHGRTHNPYRESCTPGGSSGGSGSALAAGLCSAALGTDTGGSVRIPAAYCGVVGFKPSFGRVSTLGVAPLSRRLDHVGPLTRSVPDATLMLWAMAGGAMSHDASRPTSAAQTIAQTRFGVLINLEHERAEVAVLQRFATALDQLRRLGAETRGIAMPTYDPARARRAVFMRIEIEAAAEYGELYRTEPQRFSHEMRGYLDWGLRAPAIRLVEADRVIEAAACELAACFGEVDVIVSPSTPQVAFPFSQKIPDNQGGYCVLANIAGCPAISIPIDVDASGLPIGLQFMGPRGDDERVLAVAAAYESVAGCALTPPPPYGPSAGSQA